MTHWGSQVRVLYSPFKYRPRSRGAVVLREKPPFLNQERQPDHATLAQLIEQLICNLQVLGLSPRGGYSGVISTPPQPTKVHGRVSKRPKDGDCKSSCVSIRWFESTRAHYSLQSSQATNALVLNQGLTQLSGRTGSIFITTDSIVNDQDSSSFLIELHLHSIYADPQVTSTTLCPPSGSRYVYWFQEFIQLSPRIKRGRDLLRNSRDHLRNHHRHRWIDMDDAIPAPH